MRLLTTIQANTRAIMLITDPPTRSKLGNSTGSTRMASSLQGLESAKRTAVPPATKEEQKT